LLGAGADDETRHQGKQRRGSAALPAAGPLRTRAILRSDHVVVGADLTSSLLELDDPARDRAVSLVGPFIVWQSPALVEDSLLLAVEAACDRQCSDAARCPGVGPLDGILPLRDHLDGRTLHVPSNVSNAQLR
jgi:hypothetical protein